MYVIIFNGDKDEAGFFLARPVLTKLHVHIPLYQISTGTQLHIKVTFHYIIFVHLQETITSNRKLFTSFSLKLEICRH